jgi:hypothetical protein
MKRCCWALLIFELFLFALILVLPQVNLPALALGSYPTNGVTVCSARGVPAITVRGASGAAAPTTAAGGFGGKLRQSWMQLLQLR